MKKRILFTVFSILFLCNNSIGQLPERIFYSTFSPQDWDIYISHDNGQSIKRFTENPSLDYDAVISPDGIWVVFTSERSGLPQLYVKPVDESQPARRLIDTHSFQDQAAFSPDGSMLAFVGSHEDNAEIYIIPFLPDTTQDATAAVNLTNNPGGDFRPAFSPDGEFIAFSSDRAHEIVPHPMFPFARQRKGDVFKMDITGENLVRLTDTNAWDGSPVWSDDGTKIVFYSGRSGNLSLYEMNTDGSNQIQLANIPGDAVSPKPLQNGNIAFTTWKNQQDFKVLQVNTSTNEVSPLFTDSLDLMFNVDVHPSGIMVFHGGYYPFYQGNEGRFGFDGDVLAKLPGNWTIGEHQVDAFGVRRAFVAPPQLGNTLLYYDSTNIQSFFDFLMPLGYSIFLLPLIIVTLFITGVVQGIRKRKVISFWKYLLFSVLTIIIGITVGGIFLFVDAINPMPLHVIRIVMGVLFVVLVASGWWMFKKSTKQFESSLEVSRLTRLYGILFYGLALFSLLCVLFINHFVYSDLPIYQVDYETGEIRPVFVLKKESNTNPANFSMLDSKVTHDGKSLIMTTGSFRASATTQGDIWKYDFDSGEVTKLSDSPYNDGFGDISDDGKMVFRSGRSGNFDIYLKTGDEIQNLTNDIHRDNFPAISKQGDKIVFASDRLRAENEYKTMDIFLMQINDDDSWTEPQKISIGAGQNAHAHFSPDGEWVIYTTEGYGINDEQALIQPIIFSPQMYGEIIAYNITTKERVRLTHNKWEEGTPLWVE